MAIYSGFTHWKWWFSMENPKLKQLLQHIGISQVTWDEGWWGMEWLKLVKRHINDIACSPVKDVMITSQHVGSRNLPESRELTVYTVAMWQRIKKLHERTPRHFHSANNRVSPSRKNGIASHRKIHDSSDPAFRHGLTTYWIAKEQSWSELIIVLINVLLNLRKVRNWRQCSIEFTHPVPAPIYRNRIILQQSTSIKSRQDDWNLVSGSSWYKKHDEIPDFNSKKYELWSKSVDHR